MFLLLFLRVLLCSLLLSDNVAFSQLLQIKEILKAKDAGRASLWIKPDR